MLYSERGYPNSNTPNVFTQPLYYEQEVTRSILKYSPTGLNLEFSFFYTGLINFGTATSLPIIYSK